MKSIIFTVLTLISVRGFADKLICEHDDRPVDGALERMELVSGVAGYTITVHTASMSRGGDNHQRNFDEVVAQNLTCVFSPTRMGVFDCLTQTPIEGGSEITRMADTTFISMENVNGTNSYLRFSVTSPEIKKLIEEKKWRAEDGRMELTFAPADCRQEN